MRRHRWRKSISFVNIFLVAILLIAALLLSSCSPVKSQDESPVPLIDPEKVSEGQLDDNQGKDETDNLAKAVEDGEIVNDDVTDSIYVDAGKEVKELDVTEDMQLGELKVDMTKDEVAKVMKSELVDSTIKEEYDMETEIQTYKDGTVINLLNGKVYSISVKSSDYITPRGLKTGDTEDTLQKLYGEPSAVEDGKWIYSSRGYDMFFVTVEKGIVVEIMISQVL